MSCHAMPVCFSTRKHDLWLYWLRLWCILSSPLILGFVRAQVEWRTQ